MGYFGSVEKHRKVFLWYIGNSNKAWLFMAIELILENLLNNLVKNMLKYGHHFEKEICWSKIRKFLMFL